MRAYECPSCGAPVNFQSAGAVFAVCSHCQSMVVRTDVALESIGKMALLPPDNSPLQVGTTGRWRDQVFTLRGRVRLSWSDGSWTEWYAELVDGTYAWIAETQGFFTVSCPTAVTEAPRDLAKLVAGEKTFLADRSWEVVDRKTVSCVFAEGELPFVAKPGTTRISVDLAGNQNEFASLEQSDAEVEFFLGVYAEPESLEFKNLRPVPGWSDEAPNTICGLTHSVACPNCGATVQLRAAGLTLAAVCGSCQTILDPAGKDVAVVQRAKAVQDELHPVLDLGIRGNFGGTAYEVIGFVVRADSFTRWSEYLLYNPWHGFLWLVSYAGHWSVVRRILSVPFVVDLKTISSDGKRYQHFAQAQTTVEAVLGEFYWRIQRGEKSLINDYIDPPKVLSSEKYPDLVEETWSLGEYRTPAQIAEAFNLKSGLPSAEGPYLNEPNLFTAKIPHVLRLAGLALSALVLLEGAFWMLRPEHQLYSQVYTFAGSPAGSEELATPKFALHGARQPLHIEASAPLSNSWIDLDYQLVDASSGESRSASTELSYYSGYDSDGSWTEGKRTRTIDLAAVPPGEYFLRIEPSLDQKASGLPVTVTVRTGGIFWSNFVLCALLMLSYPAWLVVQSLRFETRRWAESDFPRSVSPSNDD